MPVLSDDETASNLAARPVVGRHRGGCYPVLWEPPGSLGAIVHHPLEGRALIRDPFRTHAEVVMNLLDDVFRGLRQGVREVVDHLAVLFQDAFGHVQSLAQLLHGFLAA